VEDIQSCKDDLSMNEDFKPDFHLACELALATGRLLAEFKRDELAITHKGEINLVTAADQAAENYLRERLAHERPGDSILGEEGGGEIAGDRVWVVDPLDGTTNYAHGYPAWCISIALMSGGRSVLGAVYDPTRDELFSTQLGSGARLNGNKLAVSKQSSLDQAFIATGFPYDLRERPDEVLAPFTAMVRQTLGVRRAGSAALDLCYVAAGRFDSFWEFGLFPWDTAAAALMVSEAGGKVTNTSGSDWHPEQKFIIASNGFIHDELLQVINNSTGGGGK
jgi:myo-inositol-1(or 4)-monophosphatase